tara:strand:+ start:2078 stop:3190 length:1113 start_codon:yes stop_codon:yes gene_type:complete
MNVRMFDLRVKDQNIRKELNKNFKRILDHGIFFFGPELEKFEKKMSKFLKMKYTLGVSSGSSALYLALKSLGIKRGDEVITSPYSWVITSNAIVECGATPVFIDVKDDYNLDADLIIEKITSKTKAIVPMHWAGHMCEMEKIKKIAKKYKLFVVEDAAQAFGAEYKKKKSGSFSDVAAFSMNPMKPFNGYGEGGLIATNSKKIYEKIKILRYAGTTSDINKKITNNCLEVSLNHKMDTINAAMLLASFKFFKKKVNKLKKVKKFYDENLHPSIKRVKIDKFEISGMYAYPIQVNKRDKIKKYLDKKNIETKIVYDPIISEAPAYKKFNKNNTPNAKIILSKTLNIPIHEKLTKKELKYAVDNINYSVKNL